MSDEWMKERIRKITEETIKDWLLSEPFVHSELYPDGVIFQRIVQRVDREANQPDPKWVYKAICQLIGEALKKHLEMKETDG